MADDGARRAATLDAVREALATHDLAAIGAMLADDARWYGCRSRDDVLGRLREQFAAAAPQVHDARMAGDHIVVQVGLPGAPGERWLVLRRDERGLICELLDFASEAAMEHDLALLARGPQDVAAPGVDALVPFVHVADVGASVAFYALLGFRPVSTFEPGGELAWAFLESGERGRLMLARASAPIDHREQAVLFYLYADDLAGLRDHLVAHGVAVGEIFDGTPAPKQQMRAGDPDGYVLMIAQAEPAP